MEAAFTWLQNLTEWLARFVPRWQILDPTLGWLKFYGSGEVKAGRGGWVCHWPITTKLEVHSVAEQTIKLEPQSLITTDGHDVTVRAAIVYEFSDVHKAFTAVVDPDDAVRDKALMIVFQACSHHTKDELQKAAQDGSIDHKMKLRAARLLRPYGVRVIRMGLIEQAGAQAFRVISSSGSGEMAIPMPVPM